MLKWIQCEDGLLLKADTVDAIRVVRDEHRRDIPTTNSCVTTKGPLETHGWRVVAVTAKTEYFLVTVPVTTEATSDEARIKAWRIAYEILGRLGYEERKQFVSFLPDDTNA